MEKKVRKSKFTQREINVLLNQISLHRDVIVKRGFHNGKNKLINVNKKRVWSAITDSVNNADDISPYRTVFDVKKKWNDLTTNVRRYKFGIEHGTNGGQSPTTPLKMPAFYDTILEIISKETHMLMNRNEGGLSDEESGLNMTVEHADERSFEVNETLNEDFDVIYDYPLGASAEPLDEDSSESEEKVPPDIAEILNREVKVEQRSPRAKKRTLAEIESIKTSSTTAAKSPCHQSTPLLTTTTLSSSTTKSFISTLSFPTQITSSHSQQQQLDHNHRIPFVLPPGLDMGSTTITTIPIGLPFDAPFQNISDSTPAQMPSVLNFPSASTTTTTSSHHLFQSSNHPQFFDSSFQPRPNQVMLKHMKRRVGCEYCSESSYLWDAYLESEIQLNAEKVRLKKMKQEYYIKKMETLDKGNYQL